MVGDYEWTNAELGDSLGNAWIKDRYGQLLLRFGMYEPGSEAREYARKMFIMHMETRYALTYGDNRDDG